MIGRRCPYCDKYLADLSHHLKTKHYDVKDVAFALRQNPTTRIKLFSEIRNQGMEKTNKVECTKSTPKFERKRKSKSKLRSVMCSNCKCVLLSKNMSRHKKICSDAVTVTAIDVKTLEKGSNLSKEFQTQVLGTLRNDSVSDSIKKDEGILLIGMMRFERLEKNKDKAMEIRKSVRNDMRKLAILYNHFKYMGPKEQRYFNSIDMFHKENIPMLRKAIVEYTEEGEDIKAGLKVSLKFLIANAAKILEGLFFFEKKNDEALVISSFLSVMKLLDNQMFGSAYYKINKTRLRTSRKPKQLPLEQDLVTIRDYSRKCIAEITGKIFEILEPSEYVQLRNTVCARLTLFNARRGGEPARMLLSEFEEAKRNEWLGPSDLKKLDSSDDLTAQLAQAKIAYLMGKGNKSLVPVIILHDTWKAMEMLTDINIRELVGIAPSNPFVFAPIRSSAKDVNNHISGWHALSNVCNSGQIVLQSKTTITATRNRHYVSTYYSNIEIPQQDRDTFYEHMGHSKDTNAENYQCPPALRELISVGKHLAAIDHGKLFGNIILETKSV